MRVTTVRLASLLVIFAAAPLAAQVDTPMTPADLSGSGVMDGSLVAGVFQGPGTGGAPDFGPGGGVCTPTLDGQACEGGCADPDVPCTPKTIIIGDDGLYHITECACESGCHINLTPPAGLMCESDCLSSGETCTLISQGLPDGTVAFSCTCHGAACQPVSMCNPNMPGSCTKICEGICPNGEACIPKKLTDDGSGLPPVVTECDCDPYDGSECHPVLVDTTPPSVQCLGSCPSGLPCDLVTMVNPDGGLDYTCSPCTPETGACCVADAAGSTCILVSAASCAAQGGIYHGDGSSCTPDPCNGACCVYDEIGVPTCVQATPNPCVAMGGMFLGFGVSCTPNPCPQAQGACCLDVPGVGPTCITTTQADCLMQNGTYNGDGTQCWPDSCCPRPTKIYAVDFTSGLWEIDPDALTVTSIGTFSGGFNLAAGPNTTTLFGTDTGGTLVNYLIGSGPTTVGGPVPGVALGEGKDGWLYAGDGVDLYRVDPSTAITTLLGSGFGTYTGDLASDPSGNLYGTTTLPSLVQVSKIDGSQATVGPNLYYFWGLAWTLDGRLFGSTPSGELHQINPATGASTLVMPLGFTPADLADETPRPCQPCTPPPAGMTAWWPLDETTGTTAKNIAGSINGTYSGGVTSVPGQVDNASSLNGTSAFVNVPTHPSLNFGMVTSTPASGDFSIDAWIRTSTTSGVQPIVDKRSGSAGSTANPVRGYTMFLFNGNLALQLADGIGVAFTNYISSAAVADGQWRHVAVTVDRDNANGIVFYVNGAPVGTANPTGRQGSLANPANLRIGARAPIPSVVYFNGLIDEVEIFKRALAASEVQAIFDADSSGKCKDKCHVPNAQFCKNQLTKTVTMTICNHSTVGHSYQWSLAGLPPGPGCNVFGPTVFSPSSGTLFIPAGQCVSFLVVVTRPPGLVAPLTGCYQMTVTNLDTNHVFQCHGSVQAVNQWCLTWIGVPLNPVPIVVGVPKTLSVSITNDAVSVRLIDFAIDAISMESGAASIVSLNGLPPGERVIDTLSVLPGETVAVPVEVQMTAHEPFAAFDLFLHHDSDNDGVIEYGDALNLWSVPTCAGDFDSVGGPGQADYSAFQACLTGPSTGPVNPECSCGDVDLDVDVDLFDFSLFAGSFTGQEP